MWLRDRRTEKQKKKITLTEFPIFTVTKKWVVSATIPVVPDRCEVLRWKDRKWRGLGLNISSLFHPGSDQDRIRGLDRTCMSHQSCASKLWLYRQGPRDLSYDAWGEDCRQFWNHCGRLKKCAQSTEKEKHRLCLRRNIDRFGITVCGRKDDCFVVNPIPGQTSEDQAKNLGRPKVPAINRTVTHTSALT